MGRAMAHEVRFRSLTEKVRVRFDGIPSGNRGGVGGTQTEFSSGTAVPFSPWLRRRSRQHLKPKDCVRIQIVHLSFMRTLMSQ